MTGARTRLRSTLRTVSPQRVAALTEGLPVVGAIAFCLVASTFLALDSPAAQRRTALFGGCLVMSSLLCAHALQRSNVHARDRLLLALRDEHDRRLAWHRERIEGVLGVSRILGTTTRPQAVFDAITRTCLRTFACDQVSLMLLADGTDELVVRAAAGHVDPGKVLGARLRVGDGIAGAAARTGQPLVLDGAVAAGAYVNHAARSEPVAQAIVVPIHVRDELVGVLNVSNRERRELCAGDDLPVLEVFAEIAGACIRHAQHTEWVRQIAPVETVSVS